MNALTVTQLATMLKTALEESFPRVSVVGEISGFKPHVSGHFYYTLKDSTNYVQVTMWRSDAARLKFAPANGQQVVLRGRVSFYGPQGKCQLYADSMEPVGVGAADLAKRQLVEKLRAKGYFDESRKRSLPPRPRRIAIVSSATGAVVRDMLEVLAQRWPLCEAIVHHASVQGEAAPRELVLALRRLYTLHANGILPLDAIIVGRGGGSAEDLAAFDSELLADAIFQSPLPVVAAVGHEIDVSIADLVADISAETPSIAITKLTPHRNELIGRLEVMPQRFRVCLEAKVVSARRRLDMIAKRPAFARPLDRIRHREQMLDTTAERLRQAMARRLRNHERKVTALAQRLESLSPLGVIQRGYSLTRRADGTVLRDATTVSPGEEIVTTLAQGQVRSVVS